MSGIAQDVASLVLEELKRGDGPRSVELRLGKFERGADYPVVVIEPRVEKGRIKLDVFTQYGNRCEWRTASGLSVEGAFQLAIADAQARGFHGVSACIHKDRGEDPVANVHVPLDNREKIEETLRRLVRAVSE